MKNKIQIPKTIIIASHNLGKVKEINILLNDIGVSALPISTFSDKEPIEDGENFIENALIKARSAKNLSKQTSLADDSGLCIDSLNGEPGIYSARWAGINKDFKIAMSNIEEKMKGFKNKNAHFVCALALVTQKNEEYVFEGIVKGEILEKKRGDKGFGYDPVFLPEEYDQSFAELPFNEKNKISHRALALKKLNKFLNEKIT